MINGAAKCAGSQSDMLANEETVVVWLVGKRGERFGVSCTRGGVESAKSVGTMKRVKKLAF